MQSIQPPRSPASPVIPWSRADGGPAAPRLPYGAGDRFPAGRLPAGAEGRFPAGRWTLPLGWPGHA